MSNVAQTTYKLNPFSEPLSVPSALASKRSWICWKAVADIGKDGRPKPKPKKFPILVGKGPSDFWQKAENHVSYDEAVAAREKHGLAGVGFVLVEGAGLIGGDLDGCRDPVTGAIAPWAQAIIDLRETYFEVSPSGEGVRFWALRGDLPVLLKKEGLGIELYSTGRYLTFTGDHIAGTPWEVQRAEDTIKALMKRAADFKPSTSTAGQPVTIPGSFEEVSNRAAYNNSPMGRINTAAMKDFDAWVPELLPSAEKTADGGYRVKSASADLNRPLQEDLSIHPTGIKDWGVHDLGDLREGKRSPIDVVMEWSDPPKALEDAAEWLGVRVGLPFVSLDPSGGGSRAQDKTMTDWEAALARLRLASPRPNFIVAGSMDIGGGVMRFDPSYSGPVASRPQITDRLTRGLVSSVASAANAGKSTYLGDESMAVACERPDILGQGSIDWCGRVLVVSNEESENVLKARWRGQMREFGIAASDFKHPMDTWPTDRKRLRIGRGGKDKSVVPTADGVGFVVWLAEQAEAGQPVAFIGFDTLVSIFEGVDENGAEMDKAVGLLVAIADAGFIAVDVMQHQGKTADKESIQSYRGSSAIFAALGEMSTLIGLDEKQAAALGLDPALGRRTIRMVGQRQRDGVIPGVYYFSREILSLAAEDPRTVGVLGVKSVAVLRPMATPSLGAGGDVDVLWRTLWREQAGGNVVVRRGGATGKTHADQAWEIMARVEGWARRRTAETVDKLVAMKGATPRSARDPNGNLVGFLDIVEPPTPNDPF